MKWAVYIGFLAATCGVAYLLGAFSGKSHWQEDWTPFPPASWLKGSEAELLHDSTLLRQNPVNEESGGQEYCIRDSLVPDAPHPDLIGRLPGGTRVTIDSIYQHRYDGMLIRGSPRFFSSVTVRFKEKEYQAYIEMRLLSPAK